MSVYAHRIVECVNYRRCCAHALFLLRGRGVGWHCRRCCGGDAVWLVGWYWGWWHYPRTQQLLSPLVRDGDDKRLAYLAVHMVAEILPVLEAADFRVRACMS